MFCLLSVVFFFIAQSVTNFFYIFANFVTGAGTTADCRSFR